MDLKLQKKLESIVKKHQYDKNLPQYVISIEELLELENNEKGGE